MPVLLAFLMWVGGFCIGVGLASWANDATPETAVVQKTSHGFSYEELGDVGERQGVFIIEADGEKYILVKSWDGAAIYPHNPDSINVEAE